MNIVKNNLYQILSTIDKNIQIQIVSYDRTDDDIDITMNLKNDDINCELSLHEYKAYYDEECFQDFAYILKDVIVNEIELKYNDERIFISHVIGDSNKNDIEDYCQKKTTNIYEQIVKLFCNICSIDYFTSLSEAQNFQHKLVSRYAMA